MPSEQEIAERNLRVAPDHPDAIRSNETARRVWSLLTTIAGNVALGKPEQTLTTGETMSFISGGASGLGVFCARLMIEPAAEGPKVPPEEWLADLVRDQFVTAYRATQTADAAAEQVAQAAAGRKPS